MDVELAAEGALAAAWGWGWGGAGGGLLPAGTGAAPDPAWDLKDGMGGLHAASQPPGSHHAVLGRRKYVLGWTDLPMRVGMSRSVRSDPLP